MAARSEGTAMANNPREMRTDGTPIPLAWGMPADTESPFGDAAMWLTGGLSLVLWTGLVFVLTAI
jgi:hypothetical protein